MFLSGGAPIADTLLVRSAGEWVAWWSGEDAPQRWTGPSPTMAEATVWSSTSPGVERAELVIRRQGEPWRMGVVLVRVDPSEVDLQMVVPPRDERGFAGRWSIDEAPAEAVLAVNAGQFTSGPWGWLVREGRVRQTPGSGRLAPGVAVFESGQVEIVPSDSLVELTEVREGFQSYPSLLEGEGEVPFELLAEGRGVDLRHRDGRLALGILPDGRVVLALTRLVGLGGFLEAAPFGPTTPEMSAFMGAIGCVRAVSLDGGLSAQMMVLGVDGRDEWQGLRAVAAGLVATPRAGEEWGR